MSHKCWCRDADARRKRELELVNFYILTFLLWYQKEPSLPNERDSQS